MPPLPKFYIQPNPAPTIKEEHEVFAESIHGVFHDLFINYDDWWLLCWNEIPTFGSYYFNLGPFLSKSIPSIEKIFQLTQGITTIESSTLSLAFKWDIEWENDAITLHSQWEDLSITAYADALNAVSEIQTSKQAFLQEWKKLIEQVMAICAEKEIFFTNDYEAKEYEKWNEVNALLQAI